MTDAFQQSRVVDELATIFSDADLAAHLVTRAGFPRGAVPRFDTPLLFWSKVVDEARAGRLYGGVRSIVEEAAKMYPGNAVLAHYAHESPRSQPAQKGTSSPVQHSVDYLIVTALDLEAEAVLDLLEPTEERIDVNGTLVEVALLDDIRLGVVTTGPGNAAAASMTATVVAGLRPMGLVFIGVAGGIKDVGIGDVVAGTKVYAYESGKITDEGFLPRPEVARSDHAFVQLARFVGRRKKWRGRAGLDEGAIARSFVAPIAAGEKVVASSESDVARRLRSTYGDALAVEMEGVGALEAAYQAKVPGLVVRGISDLLDRKADADKAGSQPRAATNAAAFALEVILDHHQSRSSRP